MASGQLLHHCFTVRGAAGPYFHARECALAHEIAEKKCAENPILSIFDPSERLADSHLFIRFGCFDYQFRWNLVFLWFRIRDTHQRAMNLREKPRKKTN